MIGVIPNPKKSFDLDFSSQDVFEKTKYLSLLTKYKFNSRNDILKTYRFEAAEFLSIGIYVDISISSITDAKTKVEIEILRKIGAFDKSHEVSMANDHIAKVSEGISKCITLTSDEIRDLEKGLTEAENVKLNKKWHEGWVVAFVLLTLCPPLGIILMWKNGNFNLFFRLVFTIYSLLVSLIWYDILTGQFQA